MGAYKIMYATLAYYRTTYLGQAVADDPTLTRLLTRASDDMDIACMGRIDTDDMNSVALDWLMKATCAQAESYAQEGTADTSGSVSLGSFSQSGKDSAAPGGLCKRSSRYLMFTGLMNRSVASMPVRNLQELASGGVIPETNLGVEE
jgi:hypothetical protein